MQFRQEFRHYVQRELARGLQKAQVMAIEDIHFPANFFDTIIMMGHNFGLC
jgi:hypothetical protein